MLASRTRRDRRTFCLADHAKRLNTREVAIVRHECRGVDGQGACGLDSIRELQPQRGSKPCCTLGDADIQLNAPPGLEDGSVTSRERFIAGLQRAWDLTLSANCGQFWDEIGFLETDIDRLTADCPSVGFPRSDTGK